MTLFKSIFILFLLLSQLHALSLKEIIYSTLERNENIKASILESQSKEKLYESSKNIYNPTLSSSMNYTRLDIDSREIQIKNTLVKSFNLGINLYDGGKSIAFKKQKSYEYRASNLESINTKKEIILQVVNLFFQTKTANENIEVFKEKGITLKAQYTRMKIKYDIKMVTIDEVLKLQSEYESNQYTIEELKYQREELLSLLSLYAGRKVKNVDNSRLPTVKKLRFQESEHLQSLKLSLLAIDENVNIAKSVLKPQVKLANSLNIYRYNDYNDKLLTDLPDVQNQFNISVSMKIFDTTSKHQIESAKLAKLASKEKVLFAKKEEKNTFNLAKRKLRTQELKIKSLKSAVRMGESVYKLVKVKYQNGTVDNITYLDALSKKTYNKALYRQALNDYEIAKANYYFSSGINYEKVLKTW